MEPALRVESGDVVRFQTLDARWNLEPETAQTAARSSLERIPGLHEGHALTGPVHVRGAVVGMTLEIDILSVEPGDWGWSSVMAERTMDRLGIKTTPADWMYWRLDATNMIGRNQHGHVVKLRPFMGIMGMPPNEPGVHSTNPPRACGGNIDCRELTVGSSLYLPISVPGALFSIGDGHAAQGDGEVSSTGIECPMDAVEVRLTVRDDLQIAAPRARIPGAWVTFGFDEDLEEAAFLAAEQMVDVIADRLDLNRADALNLAGLAVDLRVTQVVNGICGVHAVLADDAIEQDTNNRTIDSIPRLPEKLSGL
jgi:acetamidase/formamidase